MPRPTCRGTASRSVSVVVYSNGYVSTQGVVKPVVTTEPLSKVVDVLDELKASEYIGRKVLLPSDEGTD